MNTAKWSYIAPVGIALAGLLSDGIATAQDISSFENGYLTFTNVNTNLYYTVEFCPNLSGLEEWDGAYRGLRDIQSNDSSITVPVGVFYRVVGRAQPASSAEVPKTGQTTSYRTGDDGDLEIGVAWPAPRFTVTTNGADEVVTDNLTRLMWIKAPQSLSDNLSSQLWADAIDFCNALTFAGHSDWRLPNVQELQSLIDYGQYNPALPLGHPFPSVTPNYFWAGTTYAPATVLAWSVRLDDGAVILTDKISDCYVWPVRGAE